MNKLYSLLGLCKKAGRLTLGNDAAARTVKSRKSRLLLLTSDISERSARGMRFLCEEYGIELMKTDLTMEQVEFYLGRKNAILSVCDSGFAEAVKRLLTTEHYNPNTHPTNPEETI